MADSVLLKPLSIKRDGNGLAIQWSDGLQATIPFNVLRQQCPCATCNDQRQKPPDLFRILSDKDLLAANPEPRQMLPRGHYAYQIVWKDGHDTGIYTIDFLRQLSKPS